MQAAPPIETSPACRTSDRSPRIAAGTLLLASLLFAGAAAASFLGSSTFEDSPGVVFLASTFEDSVGVFCASAFPGLLFTLLLWSARPHRVPRPVRQLLVAVTFLCATFAAALPLAFRVT